MKWIDFARPQSVKEAIDVLAERGDRARPLAGGTDLIVQLRTGVHDPDYVVDVKQIPELDPDRMLGEWAHAGRGHPMLPNIQR